MALHWCVYRRIIDGQSLPNMTSDVQLGSGYGLRQHSSQALSHLVINADMCASWNIKE